MLSYMSLFITQARGCQVQPRRGLWGRRVCLALADTASNFPHCYIHVWSHQQHVDGPTFKGTREGDYLMGTEESTA